MKKHAMCKRAPAERTPCFQEGAGGKANGYSATLNNFDGLVSEHLSGNDWNVAPLRR